jgi:hypothetical protein
MKNIPSFDSFINESIINEAAGPDLREVKKCMKEFMKRTKFIKNMQGMDWQLPSEPIIVTNKDLDIKGSASGNYLITAVYEKYGPKYMIEFHMVMPNPKFPGGMGSFTKEFDKNVWEKFANAHKNQLLSPNQLNVKTITDASVFVEKFLTDELNALYNTTAAAAPSILSEFQKMFKVAEVTELSDGRIRLNYWFKRAGDGSAVPKTNLFFIVDPQHQTVQFKNPDKITPNQETYTSMRELHNLVGAMISDWKSEDKAKYNNMSLNAFRDDR